MTYVYKPFVVLLLLCSICLQGAVVFQVPITQLVSDADTVVIGLATPTVIGTQVALDIRVDRVLKGMDAPGQSIRAAVQSTASRRPTQISVFSGKREAKSSFGLFFLKQGHLIPVFAGQSGSWQSSFIKVPEQAPGSIRSLVLSSVAQGASPLERVLAEIAIATETGVNTGYDLVRLHAATGARVLDVALARYATSNEPRLRVLGVRLLLVHGDLRALALLPQALAEAGSNEGYRYSLLKELRESYANVSHESIETLGALATRSSATDVAAASGAVLARLHPVSALPFLAILLEHPHPDVRSIASGGFSNFALNVMPGEGRVAPGEWPYRTPETIARSGYLAANATYWKQWWSQYRTAISR